MLKLLNCSRGHFWEAPEPDEPSPPPACPECGAPPDTLPLFAIEPAPAPPVAEPVVPVAAEGEFPAVAGYEVLEYLGKGPTGIRLYRARQLLAGREVQLEIVLAREDATQRAWSSLRSEAAALGKLSHPHVLPLYETGERGRELFYNAVEWAAGPTLEQKVAEKLLPLATVAELMELLARAVDHAHENNVLHRHLEPARVLLQPVTPPPSKSPARDEPGGGTVRLHSGYYLPRISGFGLARRAGDGDLADAELYEDPGFLSPEQAWARSRDLGPLTDVYGLGGILYFLLCGRAPFRGPSLGDVIDAVQTAELVRPSATRYVSADLEAICKKCLSRQPKRRYASAAALADDLRRVRLRLPPLAVQEGALGQTFRWVRRHPALATALTLASLGLFSSLVCYGIGVGSAFQAEREARQARQNEAYVRQSLAHLQRQHNELQKRLRLDEYRKTLERARAEVNPVTARRLLDSCPPDERRFEWQYVAHRVSGQERVALPGSDKKPVSLAFHPQNSGLLLVASRADEGEQSEVQVWDVPGRSRRASVSLPNASVRHAGFSPDGRLVAVLSDSQLEVHGFDSGGRLRLQTKVVNLPADPRTFAFSPDSAQIAVAGGLGQVQRVAAATGAPIGLAFGAPGFNRAKSKTVQVAYRPDGRSVALGMSNGSHVQLWQPEGFRGAISFDGPAGFLALAVSPQDVLAAAWGDGSVHLYGTMAVAPLVRLPRPPREVVQMVFSPDGSRLAILDVDGTVQIWGQAASGWEHLLTFSAPGTQEVAFSSSGLALATRGENGVSVYGAAGR